MKQQYKKYKDKNNREIFAHGIGKVLTNNMHSLGVVTQMISEDTNHVNVLRDGPWYAYYVVSPAVATVV